MYSICSGAEGAAWLLVLLQFVVVDCILVTGIYQVAQAAAPVTQKK